MWEVQELVDSVRLMTSQQSEKV